VTAHTPESQLESLLRSLLEQLQLERQALITRDARGMEETAAAKAVLCSNIKVLYEAQPQLLANLSKDTTPSGLSSDTDHKTLLELASATKDYNLVNGKILNRTQQSTRVLLGILSGKSIDEIDGIYNPSGQSASNAETSGPAFARA